MKNDHIYKMYFDDILMAIYCILEYIQIISFQEFKRDYKIVDAVIRGFEIIGNAAKNIPNKIKEQYLNMPLDKMYSLQNRISHAYFGIDYKII